MTDQKPVETQTAVKPHRSIAAALAAAQGEMERAKKSANNPHFKKAYADLDSVCDAAMPALNKHGIAVVQPLQKDGEDWLVMTRFVHGETGETMETPMPLLLGKRDMQGLGSAITYARRYGLMTLAGIAPEDDDGNAAAASGPAPQREAQRQQNQEPDTPTAQRAADKMVSALRKSGASVADNDQFKRDLERMKAEAPQIASQVEAEIQTQREAHSPAPNADLGFDELPY